MGFLAVADISVGVMYFDIREPRRDYADARERLARMETIHTEQYFSPVHIRHTDLPSKPFQEYESIVL